VQPIYAGSYQDTIVKALTAHKAGTPPVASVLLSTDTFTLIDEDAVVPIDNFVKTADDKAWLGSFYKAFMLNSQIGGKTWGVPVPAQHRRAVLEQGALQGSRPGPEQAAGQLGRAGRAWRRS
jgi:shikimate kinase